MVTVLITSFLILVVISFGIYRWQRVSSNDMANQPLPPAPDFDGLFADSVAKEQVRLNAAQFEVELVEKRRLLLARAAEGDKSVLIEAHQTGEPSLYEDVLNSLVQRAENAKQVLALASYVSRNAGLPVNATLAKAFVEIWKSSPDRHTTAEMLHFGALAGDAALYQEALELVLIYWRDQRLKDITPEELVTLVESEFWLLPSDARNSGAGFLLKRELAKIRREFAGGK